MASGRIKYKVDSPVPFLTLLPFKFMGNGSSNPATSSFKGRGIASIVRTSAGIYTVTMGAGNPGGMTGAPWSVIFGGFANVNSAASGAWAGQVRAQSTANRTFTVELYLAGTLTDAGTTDEVQFFLACGDSSQSNLWTA